MRKGPESKFYKRSVVAVGFAGALAVTASGCSSAARQQIEQAAGIDTLSHAKQPNGSNKLELNSNYWDVTITIDPSGKADVAAGYSETGLTTAKATGSLACNDGTLSGTVKSEVSALRLKTLHVQGVHMEAHPVSDEDSSLCVNNMVEIDNVKDARTLTEDLFGKRSVIYSDAQS